MRFLRSLFTVLALIACLPASGALAESPMVYSERGAAISGYDPVAYFTIGRPVPGKPEYAVVWKRAEWRFATVENRALFEANPRAYAPQYGGYCAYGVAKGILTTTKPDVWAIHDGRLYLVHNPAVHALWTRDVTVHVELADANWPRVLRD